MGWAKRLESESSTRSRGEANAAYHARDVAHDRARRSEPRRLFAPVDGREAIPALRHAGDGSSRAMALHRYFEQSRAGAIPCSAQAEATPPDRDVADVALLEDRGDLVVRRNAFDLEGASLRFRPNQRGGYDAARLAGRAASRPATPSPWPPAALPSWSCPSAFPSSAGCRIGPSFTPTAASPLARPAWAASRASPTSWPDRRAWPRSSRASTPRGRARSRARLLPDRAVFDWRDVPGAGQINRNSFQAILYPTGEIDLAFGEMQTREGVVGLSPGRRPLEVTAADLVRGRAPRLDGARSRSSSARPRRSTSFRWPAASTAVIPTSSSSSWSTPPGP